MVAGFWGCVACWIFGCMFVVCGAETTMPSVGLGFGIPLLILGSLCFVKFIKSPNNEQTQTKNNTTTTLHKTYQIPTLTDDQINQIVNRCKSEMFSQYNLELLGKSISNKIQTNLLEEVLENIKKHQSEIIENEVSYGREPTAEEKKRERNKMTDKLRTTILTRDNYTCKNCGLSRHQEPHLCLHVDHIIPIAKGGKTHEKNLQTLCWECNLKKGDKI